MSSTWDVSKWDESTYAEEARRDDPLTRAQRGLDLFEQLKQMDDEARTLYAVSELEYDDLRDMVVFHLFHWHGQADQHGNSAWWSK